MQIWKQTFLRQRVIHHFEPIALVWWHIGGLSHWRLSLSEPISLMQKHDCNMPAIVLSYNVAS